MIRYGSLLLLALFSTYSVATAGIYGILTGQVLDAQKHPVVGATVLVNGTKRGAYTKANGKFTIVKLLAGNYTIVVKSIGFNKYSTSITIMVDQTTDVSMSLTLSAKQPAEEITGVPIALIKQSGVLPSGNGFCICVGSRNKVERLYIDSVEAMRRFLIDGLEVNDLYIGYTSELMPTYFFTAGNKDKQNTYVSMGGYAAEYGYALPHIAPMPVQQQHVSVAKVSRPFVIVE